MSANAAARELLLGQGYQVVRHNFRMLIEIQGPPPQPTVPEGIIIRPFIRDQEGRALIRAMREAFRDELHELPRKDEKIRGKFVRFVAKKSKKEYLSTLKRGTIQKVRKPK